ncbi:hypothetical protein G7Y89_g9683 [Cudoniella acicularis]|uniref:Uncharacterized protein n=1 Tax=Cudoniella acicularis TaxID=354080 RepID=A0A8H4VZE7_9HELO|nr:hypothetical protein G7Y89_g9683 [Cudoniella acicularis]
MRGGVVNDTFELTLEFNYRAHRWWHGTIGPIGSAAGSVKGSGNTDTGRVKYSASAPSHTLEFGRTQKYSNPFQVQ